MTTFTDEELSAFLDGELSPERAGELERARLDDQDLADRLARLSEANARFTQAFEPIADLPVPEHLLALVEDQPTSPASDEKIIAFPQKANLFARWSTPLAAAACLMLGLGVGVQWAPTSSPSSDALVLAGTVDAGSHLYEVLETVASGQTRYDLTPSLTYPASNGGFCREVDSATARTLACRDEQGGWTVLASMLQPRTESGTSYVPASSGSHQLFDQLADQMMADAPLDSEQEREIIARRWLALSR